MELKYLDKCPDLRTAVYQAMGAASVCWKPMEGTGVFQEARAGQIAEELLFLIHQFQETPDADMIAKTAAQLAAQHNDCCGG